MTIKPLALAFTFLWAVPCFADSLPALPSLAVPFATQTPRLDASPGDPAWKGSALIPALTTSLVLDGKQATPLPTQVRVLWDANFLYVRFLCDDSDVYTRFKKRDAPHYQSDVAEVFLDVVGDGQHYYEIQLSPRGGIFDQYIALTTAPRSDEYGKLLPEITSRDFWPNPSWNCNGLRTATRILRRNGHDVGWIAELALPAKAMLKRLGQTNFASQTLRANFLRYDWQPKTGTKDRELVAHNWSTVVHGCPHISPSRMGLLRLEKATP